MHSTAEAVERTGLTISTLHRYATKGFCRPPVGWQRGSGSRVVWSDADLAACCAVSGVLGASGDTRRRTQDLARLASSAVYRWHGRAPWAVVALEGDTLEPAWSAEEVATICRGMTVATVIGLEP